MASALPVYHAAVNWPRYTFVYFSDVDLSAYKRWARRHPEYFSRRPSPRRMASGVQMRINIKAENGRYTPELTLSNVIKDSKCYVSLITRTQAMATRGELLASTEPCDPRRQIRLRIRRPNSAASETETFVVVENCPDGHDAVLRHDLNLESDSGVYPIGLSHRNKTEREEQRRRVEEARLKRQEEKKEEDQRFEEAARQRQQLQQSGPGQISGRSREPAQQQHSRRPDQRGSGTAGQHAT